MKNMFNIIVYFCFLVSAGLNIGFFVSSQKILEKNEKCEMISKRFEDATKKCLGILDRSEAKAFECVSISRDMERIIEKKENCLPRR